MRAQEAADLRRLESLAFRRKERYAVLIQRFYGLSHAAKKRPDFRLLERAYPWLLVPFSLWPIDAAGLLKMLLDEICAKRRLTDEVPLLMELLGKLPSAKEQAVVAAHEHEVQLGSYEGLISAQHKFDLMEELLSRNVEFQADWEKLKRAFNVETYRNRKGIIRRRMTQERNFRPEGWQFQWKTKEDRFRVAFDAFCHKWVLYGMEGERPLLQKLSVNVTPLGTMIFVPRYWSFDRKRDLKWKAITRLHRSRDVHRQGVKLTSSQLARHQEAIRATRLWQQASAAGLKGDARSSWVMGKLGWDPRTDERQLRRLFSEIKGQASRD